MYGIKRAGLEVRIAGLVERKESPLLVGSFSVTGDRSNLIYLEIQRTVAIRHDVEFGKSTGDQNAIEGLFEQIDSRCAEQVKTGFIDAPLQAGIRFVQSDNEVHFIAACLRKGFLEVAKAEEKKAPREGEIFAQQPVALESMGRGRKHRFLRRKAHPAN